MNLLGSVGSQGGEKMSCVELITINKSADNEDLLLIKFLSVSDGLLF